MHKVSRIVLCSTCKGNGYRTKEVCVDYHKRDYGVDIIDCPYCDNKGRLVETVVTTYEKLKDVKYDRD